MILDNLPKINIGVAVMILICFFLPWVSIDCGNIPVMKLSGFQIATGKISLDNGMMNNLKQQMGEARGEDMAFEEAESEQIDQQEPHLFLFLVIMFAIGMMYFSFKMIDDYNRYKAYTAAAFGVFGSGVMAAGAGTDFGMNIPAEAALVIQTSYQFGFYATLSGFVFSAGSSLMYVKVAEGGGDFVELDLPIGTQPDQTIGAAQAVPEVQQVMSNENTTTKTPIKQASSQTKRVTVPPGAKTCPSCGTVVGLYQAKCMKCGSNLKSGSK